MMIEEKRCLYQASFMMRNSRPFEKLTAVPTAESINKLEPVSFANWIRGMAC